MHNPPLNPEINILLIRHIRPLWYNSAMKRAFILVVVLALAATAWAVNDDDPDAAAIAVAVPNVLSIKKTSTGYLLTTANGPRMVFKNSSGYIVQSGHNADSITIRRTSSGYTVNNEAARAAAIRRIGKGSK